MTAAVIYGPRMLRLSARMQAQKARDREAAAAERAAGGPRVVPIGGIG